MITLTLLVTILFVADALDLNRFFWQGNQPQITEEVQMIEIVRWRQPVCVEPAKGVSPCLKGLRKSQSEYERATGKGLKGEKAGYSVLTDVQSKSSVSSLEREVSSKFESPEMLVSFPLEQLQPSRSSEEFFTEKPTESNRGTSILTEEQERNVREGKHLPHLEKVTKPKQIYITKVLNTPVTATLVAHNCLPDIGIPLCDDQEENIEPSKSSQHVKPSLSINLANPNEDATLDLPRIIHKPSIKSFDEMQGKKPEIVIKNPDFVQTSTSFTLDHPSTTRAPILQHIVILKDDKSVVPNVVHKPVVLNNLPPSRVFEDPSQKENSNQFAELESGKSWKKGEVDEAPKKQEISLDHVQGVDKFNLGKGKPPVQEAMPLDWLKVTDNVKETQDAANPDEQVEVEIATREK